MIAGKKFFFGLGVLGILMIFSTSAHASSLKVSSTSFKNGKWISKKYVFSGFGCTGGNISPEIRWGKLPRGTKSVAVTMFDPDAPTGSGWWHWVVYNLPPSVHELREGAGTKSGSRLPKGAVQGVTDFGVPGYGGPCPPKGDKPHHYIITVYALKTDKLGVGPGASPAQVGYFIHFSTLAKGRLVGRFGH